jgi:hypothetical protein
MRCETSSKRNTNGVSFALGGVGQPSIEWRLPLCRAYLEEQTRVILDKGRSLEPLDKTIRTVAQQ